MQVRDLEELALSTWPALQQHLYDGWVVRLSAGYTRRANSINPIYPALNNDLPSKIALCEQWYNTAHLPTIFRLTDHTLPRELDQELAARGYRKVDPSLTLHRSLVDWKLPQGLNGTLTSLPIEAWLAYYCQLSAKPLDQQHNHLAILQRIPEPHIFATLCDQDQVVACLVAALSARALCIVDVVTASNQRRRGYAFSLLNQVFDWAKHTGASGASLQVQGDNSPARALYTRLGFQDVYNYWYRVQA